MKGKPHSTGEQNDPWLSKQRAGRFREKVRMKKAGLNRTSMKTQRNLGDLRAQHTHFEMEEYFGGPVGPNPLCKSPYIEVCLSVSFLCIQLTFEALKC